MIRSLLVALFLAVSALPASAVNPDEVLADPALEARARHLSANLRCLVCQNQSIDDSNAELAKDLRLLLRERIVAGDSDDEVIAYIVSRYGEFVLLKPPLSSRTMLLWSAPFVLLALGGIVLFVSLRNRRAAGAPAKLSAEEQARLDKILGEQRGE